MHSMTSPCYGRRVFWSASGKSAGRPACLTVQNRRLRLQVNAAISRQKKEDIVSTLKEKLDGSLIVFSVRYKQLDVATQQKIRKGLPEGASAYVCKNSLMRVAAAASGKEIIGDKACKGENMWIFVPEDDIKDTIKFWFDFEEALFKEAKAAAPKGQEAVKPTEISSAFLESSYISAAELKKCQDMPTKQQLYGTIAGLIKAVPTKLGRSINALPVKVARSIQLAGDAGKLAYAIKAISELDEDKSKLAGDVAKPGA